MSSTATQAVLAVNAGSSSLKFALYPIETPGSVGLARLSGQVDGLQPGGRPCLQWRSGPAAERRDLTSLDGDAFSAALTAVHQVLQAAGGELRPVAVAHRIVHGGDRYAESVWLDAAALDYLATLSPLAPLHQPHNLAGVAAVQRALPQLPAVGCFDTAFHAQLPEVERLFALPRALTAQGIRRYGFHGLSYRYLTDRLLERTPRARGGRMLLAHLGNGASLCAVEGGRSVATTMGFSAVDGLMMGTRCGALDPGVLLHLLRQGWDADRLERLVNKESGLLGVSGLSADMRTLRTADSAEAREAIALFTHRVVREAGALVASMGGLDVLAFTGGIGEHDARLRADVVRALKHLGLRIDPEENAAATGDSIAAIHDEDSWAEIWVVPTDEGRVAAADAARLLAARG